MHFPFWRLPGNKQEEGRILRESGAIGTIDKDRGGNPRSVSCSTAYIEDRTGAKGVDLNHAAPSIISSDSPSVKTHLVLTGAEVMNGVAIETASDSAIAVDRSREKYHAPRLLSQCGGLCN
jgi:hypothetical protein